MTLHAGEIGTMTKVHNYGSYNGYNVHCNGFYWSEDMLDLVTRGNELSSPEPLDLIPKKKHYSFNFAV